MQSHHQVGLPLFAAPSATTFPPWHIHKLILLAERKHQLGRAWPGHVENELGVEAESGGDVEATARPVSGRPALGAVVAPPAEECLQWNWMAS